MKQRERGRKGENKEGRGRGEERKTKGEVGKGSYNMQKLNISNVENEEKGEHFMHIVKVNFSIKFSYL